VEYNPIIDPKYLYPKTKYNLFGDKNMEKGEGEVD